MEKNYSISPATITRTIALILALVNQVLSSTGHSVLPIEDENIEVFVTAGLTIVTALLNWWKNNSFTQNAIAADKFLECLQAKDKDKE